MGKESKGTASFIMNLSCIDNTQKKALYKLNPPVNNGDGGTCEYVVVSSIVSFVSGPETFIFPANKKGEVTCWLELDGSQQGIVSFEEALNSAGYVVENGIERAVKAIKGDKK